MWNPDDPLDDFDFSLDRALWSASTSWRAPLRHSSADAIPLQPLDSDSDAEPDVRPLMGERPGAHEGAARGGGRIGASAPRGFRARAAAFAHSAARVARVLRGEVHQWHQPAPALGAERYVLPRNSSKAHVLNAVLNAKYNPVTFIPVVLYEQFKFFFNLYFLLVALSQAVPALRIGYLLSYVVPLVFVLTVTMAKEAGDDLARRKRDMEQNSEQYEVLNRQLVLAPDVHLVAAKSLRVGDLVRLHKDLRVPADMVLLQLLDEHGEAFIKTDQLDGETDWKLRVACSVTQPLVDVQQLVNNVSLIVGLPTKDIHAFDGKLIYHQGSATSKTVPLGVEQTLWANTVLAAGSAVGIVVYTGVETRQQLNTTMLGVKTGLLELEINNLSKILCVLVFVLLVALVLAHGFPLAPLWYVDIVRFLILFSTIIPVSLRVNLDLAKSVYAAQILRDRAIPNTIVRTSTIPEDLGRVEYLLLDKTGTLTQNDMELKKLHLGAVCYAGDALDVVAERVAQIATSATAATNAAANTTKVAAAKADKVAELVLALALCHNVTPSADDDGGVLYQAASPDEIAIVRFCERAGLRLSKRDRRLITLEHAALGSQLVYEVLYNFPFSSESKRMGIVVRDGRSGECWFVQKGADTVMAGIVARAEWLDEETGNMARDGLRTLVIGRKRLGAAQLRAFAERYHAAQLQMHQRDAEMLRAVAHHLETDVELLGVTGVEDKLQRDVKLLIELLRNAGVRIWMLTGDKVETAKCVAISAKLVLRGQPVVELTRVRPETAAAQLDLLARDACLVIDGASLAVFMAHCPRDFFAAALRLPAVVACRCTPQQKADVALAIKAATGKRVCCIGDGGNDVSMIQCADVGVGIVGKEGRQALLAADFSIDQFCHLHKLLLWHGRNLYKRLAKLAQVVIHRGLTMLVAQAVYLIALHFEPLALYQGWLMVGYSTLYTMAPVFSLVLDSDIDENLSRLYPELYKELTLGRSLSYRSFFMWLAISLFQGCVIQLFAQHFHSLRSAAFPALVALSFSALVLNELGMVALTINSWSRTMAAALAFTLLVYVALVPFLLDYFDMSYLALVRFYWQTALVLAVSLLPVWIVHAVNRRLRPPSYAKVQY